LAGAALGGPSVMPESAICSRRERVIRMNEKPTFDQYHPGGVAQQSLDWNIAQHDAKVGRSPVSACGSQRLARPNRCGRDHQAVRAMPAPREFASRPCSMQALSQRNTRSARSPLARKGRQRLPRNHPARSTVYRSAPAQECGTHLVAQWRWRLGWRSGLRLRHDSRLLRGLGRNLRKPLDRQVPCPGIDRSGRCTIKSDALVMRKHRPAVGRRHFPAEKHAACVAC
jgi:hypothetical protein